MKEAVVIKVVQKPGKSGGFHSFETPNGIFWTWQVAFDNNDWGEFNVKGSNQPKFVAGQKAHYTIETNRHDPSYPAKVTWCNPDYHTQAGTSTTQLEGVRESFKEDPDRQRLIVRQTCIKAAADFLKGRSNTTQLDVTLQADFYYDWVMKPETVEAKEIVAQAIQQEEDDLPF